MTVSHIDTIVERKIEEMSKEPKTALLSLMKLSRRFSSSRFQAPVFSIVRHLLANEDSQYHILIKHLLEQTSHSAIKNLGINLGYNSWTYGAQTIRSTMQKVGYCIPWNITFRWNPANPDGLNLKSIHQFIWEGNRMGIFSFCIRQETAHPISGEIFNLFAAYPDCTFFWFLPNQLLAPIYINMLKKYENVVSVFDESSPYCLRNISNLKERKILYGIYHTYSSADSKDQMNHKWSDYYASYGSAFVIMLADDTCSEDAQNQMSDYVYNARYAQKFPFILLDFYSDIMRINHLISGKNSFLEINSDRTLAYPHNFTESFRSGAPLSLYLASSMPATTDFPHVISDFYISKL